MTIYMIIVILAVTLLVIAVPYIIFGKVMARRGVVISNEFIANFADVSWRVTLETVTAG